LHVVLLDKLIKTDMFCQNDHAVKSTFQFIIFHFKSLEDGNCYEILGWLYSLLNALVRRSADMQNIRNYLYLEREKILDAMAATMRLKSFNFNHMSFIKSITCDLLSIEGCVSESYSAILKQILDNFEGLGGINETVEICYVVTE
uniref:Uncharacterized protein LOC114347918 n=1 Tax=Diabrotica virgifera virgifera TaxID=50390 RepID=A0A6P7GY65_DIAVI